MGTRCDHAVAGWLARKSGTRRKPTWFSITPDRAAFQAFAAASLARSGYVISPLAMTAGHCLTTSGSLPPLDKILLT